MLPPKHQVPGVNEGGFKLWEGAIDLCNYLARKYNLTDEIFTNPLAHQPLQVLNPNLRSLGGGGSACSHGHQKRMSDDHPAAMMQSSA
eukprot:1033304-Pelagomonas_calceolata.AAC.1